MHLTVKLLQNKFYRHKNLEIRKDVGECCCKYIVHLLQNSLINKVKQIKSSFYNVVLTQLLLPANIGNNINSQRNFVFIYHNIICDKS